jgi:transcription elongation GreA/GreB family factor
VLARLEKAVDATNESAHVLDRARNAAEQVRFENQASAEARVSDVERVAQLAKAVADRIAEEKRASLAQASGFSASTIQRLLG